MCECKAGQPIREEAVRTVGNLWDSTDNEGGWPMLDYINTQGEDWDALWGWLGLVPKECMKSTRKDQANLKSCQNPNKRRT